MPGSSTPAYDYYCDNCVPRGCSCHSEITPTSPQAMTGGYGENPPTTHTEWKWRTPNIEWYYTDEQGRELPCIEYWYNAAGFVTDEAEINYYKKHNVPYRISEA